MYERGEVTRKATREATRVLDKLAELGEAETSTVILMGSCARDVTHERSDVDILVIRPEDHGDGGRIKLDRPGHIDLQQDTRARFLRRLEEGDDYPAWALRFGVPIRDPGGWWDEQMRAEKNTPHWPDWRPKIKLAERRLVVAGGLLDAGDMGAASEELMFATSQVARAILLKKGEFPLSRMELPSQLRSRSPDLAEFLSKLISGGGGGLDSAALRRGEALIREEINRLRFELGDGYGTDKAVAGRIAAEEQHLGSPTREPANQ
jgi:predicted nucleotidyltransferase